MAQKKALNRPDKLQHRWLIAGVVLSAVMIFVALLAWWYPRSSGGFTITAGGDLPVAPSVGGNGCVVFQGDCIVNSESTEDDIARTKSELESLPSATLAPSGSSPWMFVVLGTKDLGLYVRDGYTAQDERLPGNPTLVEGSAVYVDCRIENGWVADPGASESGLWYKIRWPEVSKDGDFWVYGGYIFPVGHNGQVPLC